MSSVSEAIARPTRTALQLGAGTVLTELVDSFVTDLTTQQYGALVAGITLALSCLQAAVENRTGKALLRSVPPREVPVAEDAGESGVVLIVGILAIVVLVLVLVGAV
jgi:uncharacterized membrane protein YidH (DUF202 family)